MLMAKRSSTLYVVCTDCWYFWSPYKKGKSPTAYRCSECRSRHTMKATAREIGDLFKQQGVDELKGDDGHG